MHKHQLSRDWAFYFCNFYLFIFIIKHWGHSFCVGGLYFCVRHKHVLKSVKGLVKHDSFCSTEKCILENLTFWRQTPNIKTQPKQKSPQCTQHMRGHVDLCHTLLIIPSDVRETQIKIFPSPSHQTAYVPLAKRSIYKYT